MTFGLQWTGVSPEEFDFVVVNSSLFNPDPSHSTMVKDRFKLRADAQCYDLGGMSHNDEAPVKFAQTSSP